MAANLAEKGSPDKPLLIYNRTKKRSEDLVAKLTSGKAEVVDQVQDGLSRGDIIFSCLSNDRAVEDLYKSMAELGGLQGKLFVEMSTIHPDTTERIAQLVTAAGAEFVASPVFGAPPMAAGGQLIFVPAGPKASIEKLRPYIQGVMGRAEIPFEDQAYGQALRMKLIGNTFILNMTTQLAEGLTLAEKTGIGAAPVKQFVDGLFGGPWSAYADRMLQGDYHKTEEPLFSADNAIKDATHAQDLAKTAGVELHNTATAKSYLEDVAAHAGGAKGDFAGIYGAARMRAGLKYENSD